MAQRLGWAILLTIKHAACLIMLDRSTSTHQHGMPLQYWVSTQWGIFALTPQPSTNTLTLSYSGISCSPCSYPARGLGVVAGADLGMPATKCSAKFLAGQATGFLTSASACAFATSKPTVANQL